MKKEKVFQVVCLILFGASLRYIDSLFELFITQLGNWQTLSATKTQLKMSEMMPQVDGGAEDIVVGGFVEIADESYDDDEYYEE